MTWRLTPPPRLAHIPAIAISSTAGYCGADLRSLCTESGLLALRRTHPEVYSVNHKLPIDFSAIRVSAADFFDAMKIITPAAQVCPVFDLSVLKSGDPRSHPRPPLRQRMVSSPAQRLPVPLQPMLGLALEQAIALLKEVAPLAYARRQAAADKCVSSRAGRIALLTLTNSCVLPVACRTWSRCIRQLVSTSSPAVAPPPPLLLPPRARYASTVISLSLLPAPKAQPPIAFLLPFPKRRR